MGMRMRGWSWPAMMLACVLGVGPDLAPESDARHAGYYYPEPGTTAVHEACPYTLPAASRNVRLAFVTSLTNERNNAPQQPQPATHSDGKEALRTWKSRAATTHA